MARAKVSFIILPVKQHRDELDDNNAEEEEHQDDTNRLEVEILLGDEHLGWDNSVRDVSMLKSHYLLTCRNSKLAKATTCTCSYKPVYKVPTVRFPETGGREAIKIWLQYSFILVIPKLNHTLSLLELG